MSLYREWTHEGRPELRHPIENTPIPGPWMEEPDKVQWVDEASDLDCLAVRNRMGAWCGYVGIPKGHPDYGTQPADVDVHGGVTFGSECDEDAPEGHGICHLPFPGRTGEVWWIGFDCGHSFDLQPGLQAMMGDTLSRRPRPAQATDEEWERFADFYEGKYRPLGYVKRECADLARQLRAKATA